MFSALGWYKGGSFVYLKEVIMYLAYVWVPRVVLRGEGPFITSNVILYSNPMTSHTAHIRSRLGVLALSLPPPPPQGGL